MITYKLLLSLTEEMLGGLPSDLESFKRFILKASGGRDIDLAEIDAIPHQKAAKPEGEANDDDEDTVIDPKGMTVFARFLPQDYIEGVHPAWVKEELDAGRTVLCIYDYHARGVLKGAFRSLFDINGSILNKKEEQKRLGLTPWTYKRVVDTLIFAYPRKIPIRLPAGTQMGECVRTLRAETMKGERVTIANSEAVPAGSVMELTFSLLRDEHSESVLQALLYCSKHGIGQWRTGGKGTFTFEVIEETETEPDFLNLDNVRCSTDAAKFAREARRRKSKESAGAYAEEKKAKAKAAKAKKAKKESAEAEEEAMAEAEE